MKWKKIKYENNKMREFKITKIYKMENIKKLEGNYCNHYIFLN